MSYATHFNTPVVLVDEIVAAAMDCGAGAICAEDVFDAVCWDFNAAGIIAVTPIAVASITVTPAAPAMAGMWAV